MEADDRRHQFADPGRACAAADAVRAPGRDFPKKKSDCSSKRASAPAERTGSTSGTSRARCRSPRRRHCARLTTGRWSPRNSYTRRTLSRDLHHDGAGERCDARGSPKSCRSCRSRHHQALRPARLQSGKGCELLRDVLTDRECQKVGTHCDQRHVNPAD